MGKVISKEFWISKSVPLGIDYVWLDSIPSDKRYKLAWMLNADKTAIVVNGRKAREIARRNALEVIENYSGRISSQSKKEKALIAGIKIKLDFADSIEWFEKIQDIYYKKINNRV